MRTHLEQVCLYWSGNIRSALKNGQKKNIKQADHTDLLSWDQTLDVKWTNLLQISRYENVEKRVYEKHLFSQIICVMS